MRLNDFANVLKIAGDENRLKILCLLYRRTEKMCVSEVAAQLGSNLAATSHHLNLMARAGLLKPVRDGKHTCYILRPGQLTTDLKKLVCKHL